MKNVCLAAWFTAVGFAAVCTAIPAGHADDAPAIPPSAAPWYYARGGAEPYLNFSGADRTDIEVGAGVAWSLGGVCGFDPRAAFKQQFEDAQDALHNLGNDILGSVVPLARAAVLSEIRQLNPGLYDTITKGVFDAKESLRVSVKTCEQMQSDLSNGKSPTDGWIQIGHRERWARGAAAGKTPAQVADAIRQQAGSEAGIPWVDGRRAGGANTPPIHLVGDPVRAGYRHWLDGDSGLSRVFPDENAAAAWLTATVGEQTRRLCDGCNPLVVRKAQGLRVHVRKHREQARETLAAITPDGITPEQAAALSVPGMGVVITRRTLQALWRLPAEERQLLANRLASDVALAKTLEEALIARQLLATGMQDPNVQNNGEALAELERRRQLLDGEIDTVLFERRVRKEVAAETARVITERAAAVDSFSSGAEAGPPLLQDGALPGEPDAP